MIFAHACYKNSVQRASAFLLASLAVVSEAHADRYSLHGTASTDLAATDNVFSGATERDPDLIFTVRPGILATYALPRLMQELNLEAEAMRYGDHADKPSFAFRGGWKALILPGPLSEIMVQANISESVLSAISAASQPQDTMVQLVPIGQVDVLQADANEYGSRTMTREIRVSQSLFARASKSDDNAEMETIVTSAEAGGSFGIDRTWRRDTLSFEMGASVLRLQRKADPGAPMGPRLDRQLNPRARLQWRHDMSRRISGAIDGGVAVVVPFGVDPDHPDVPRHIGTFPIIGGMLAYTDAWGVATLSVRRDVTPNLFVAANTVNDTAAVAAALPLPWLSDNRRRQPRLAGVASLGFQRTQLVEEETSNLQSSFYVGLINAGIQYAPNPGVTYSARYELIVQSGDQAPALGAPIPGFYRNTVYFTAAIRFPPDVAVRVPKRRTGSVRSDRKDLQPVGAEPVIPDLVDGGEGGGEGGGSD